MVRGESQFLQVVLCLDTQAHRHTVRDIHTEIGTYANTSKFELQKNTREPAIKRKKMG